MTRPIVILGAPTSAGAYAPGQERAPAALRAHGLLEAIKATGRPVIDSGDVAGFRWRPDPTHPLAMNIEAVAAIAGAIAERAAPLFDAGNDLLLLGGDCTVELGMVAGALMGSDSVGLIYIDLDTDLNPPDDGDGALDWTGVAHLLALAGTAAPLAGFGPRRPLLSPSDVLFVGAGLVTPNERATIEREKIGLIDLAAVKADPDAAIRQTLAWADGFDRVLIHCDVDVLSFTDFPIAENVRREAGLTLAELGALLSALSSCPRLRAMTFTEINPDHAPDEAVVGRLVEMIAAVAGGFGTSRREPVDRN